MMRTLSSSKIIIKNIILINLLFRNHKRAKKRDIKSKLKNKKGRFYNYENIGANQTTKKNENRKVLDGVSIFDLIIPWKEN